MDTWTGLLLAGTALHAGFQLTVTLVVYPALAATPADRWGPVHDAHSRRITPLVALVYGVLVVVSVGWLLAGERALGGWLALAGTAAAVLLTALVAAPTHGRLGAGRDDALVHRLLVADRARAVAAAAAALGALAAALR